MRRVEPGPDGPELHRAVDQSRDQSYFLFATTAEQLAFLRFPLGGKPKAETRALARALRSRSGGQAGQPGHLLRAATAPTPGWSSACAPARPSPARSSIWTVRVLGRHDGIIGYTIGQRRGLGVGGSAEPLYVMRLEPRDRRVVVGPKAALARDRVHVARS